MEEEEIEMSLEEFRAWFGEKVKTNKLVSSDVLGKLGLLQSVLERRTKQAGHLLRLFKSVSKCEAVVKKQYSMLGWEYRGVDADADDITTSSENTIPVSPTTNGVTSQLPKQHDSENLHGVTGKNNSISQKVRREPVVVMTRLSACQIRSLRRLKPVIRQNEGGSSIDSDSDMQWQLGEDSSGSEFSASDFKTAPNKRRKLNQKKRKRSPSHARSPASSNTGAKSSRNSTATPQAGRNGNAKGSAKSNANVNAKGSAKSNANVNANSNAKSNANGNANSDAKSNANSDAKSNANGNAKGSAKSNANGNAKGSAKSNDNGDANSESKSNANGNANSDAKSNANGNAKGSAKSNDNGDANSDAKSKANSNSMNTSKPPEATQGVNTVKIITSFCQSSAQAPKTPPIVPHVELKANMNVIARRKSMSWIQGEILDKVTKKDGKLKYKIRFEEKGKSLVSGHHIALNCMPDVEHLFVGARVVVKSLADQSQFCPGVLGELPSRKNRMRFLVFMDDHKPVYVGLPLLRRVCRPLKNPLDDIPDGFHKDFINGYMKNWPYPPQTHFRVGQTINVELEGVPQSCVVRLMDCSLIQVVVSTDENKEWIYRGSPCLEQMNTMKDPVELKNDKGQKNTSPS